MNDINQTISRIIALYDSKGDPNKMMQQMLAKHPNINGMSTQFNNMTQGMDRKQAYLQIAKQRGVSEENIKGLARIMGVKQ